MHGPRRLKQHQSVPIQRLRTSSHVLRYVHRQPQEASDNPIQIILKKILRIPINLHSPKWQNKESTNNIYYRHSRRYRKHSPYASGGPRKEYSNNFYHVPLFWGYLSLIKFNRSNFMGWSILLLMMRSFGRLGYRAIQSLSLKIKLTRIWITWWPISRSWTLPTWQQSTS